MIVYFNGKYSDLDDVKVSPFDRGFQYADGVYEVMRTYNHKFFRYEDHINRLAYSLKEVKIRFVEFNEVKKILRKLVESNNQQESEVVAYIQITRGTLFPRKHSFPPESVPPTVFISTTKINNSNSINTGVKIILEEDMRWKRCDIKSISLLPAVLANQHAVEESAGETVFINKGFLTEGSHTNFFGIKQDVVFTAPLSNLILSGVTRKVVLEICKSLNIKVKESAIKKSDLENYNEFFITGTTTEIKPVVQINNWIVDRGNPGNVTQKIFNEFFKLTLRQNL